MKNFKVLRKVITEYLLNFLTIIRPFVMVIMENDFTFIKRNLFGHLDQREEVESNTNQGENPTDNQFGQIIPRSFIWFV